MKHRASAAASVFCAVVLLTLAGASALAQRLADLEPPPPTESPEGAEREPIPRHELEGLYRDELGKLYQPDDDEELFAVHELIERYFDTPAAKDRAAIAKQIQDTGVDPNVVGRLARIRMHWPAFEGGGAFYTNERHGPHDVRYFVGIPEKYTRTKPWPLVIKLPTAHAFLTDPPPGPDEVVRIYKGWIADELSRHPDAIVLMPLLNLDELYGPSYPGINGVIQPLLHVAGRVNVDPARVYMVGHSMAAHAVWNLALHYPTYFAAINPLAGAASGDWQRLRLVNLSNVLPVVWHDATDDVIKIGHSRGIVAALRKQKLDVDYEETKKLGHAPTEEVVQRCYEKLRARTRELYPATVLLQSNRPDTMFNRNDWLQVYQAVRAGKIRRLLLRHGSGVLKINEHAYRASAARPAKNRIELRTDNVASLRIYLNDQMVDFSKPVTVIVNKKPRFEGLVKPDVATMLKDQVFLGRGWRYYTAAIDIDVVETKPTTRPTTRSTTRPTSRRSAAE